MKNIITIITTLAIILTAPVNVSAQMVNNTNFNSQIIYLENGDYLETKIQSEQKPAHINQLAVKVCGQYQLQVHLPTMVQVQNVYHVHIAQKPIPQTGL